MLCLDYNGSMYYFDGEIKNMKAQYNKEYYPLICYFVGNKGNYFDNGDYNYNSIPEEICTNSSLERYNKELKKYVGNKRNCNWFIIKNKRYYNKNQNKNVRYYSKKKIRFKKI